MCERAAHSALCRSGNSNFRGSLFQCCHQCGSSSGMINGSSIESPSNSSVVPICPSVEVWLWPRSQTAGGERRLAERQVRPGEHQSG
jgi:hypothetical protein